MSTHNQFCSNTLTTGFGHPQLCFCSSPGLNHGQLIELKGLDYSNGPCGLIKPRLSQAMRFIQNPKNAFGFGQRHNKQQNEHPHSTKPRTLSTPIIFRLSDCNWQQTQKFQSCLLVIIYYGHYNSTNYYQFIIYKLTQDMANLTNPNSKLPILHTKLTTSRNQHADQARSVAVLRSEFNQWIVSLTLEQRLLALRIYAFPIIQVLRHVLYDCQLNSTQRHIEHSLAKQSKNTKADSFKRPRRDSRELSKTFLESTVLVSDGSHDYLDHICFDSASLKSPQKIFDLLMMPAPNPPADPLRQAMKNRKTPSEVARSLKKCYSIHEIAVEVINFLRQEVLLQFREFVDRPGRLKGRLEVERRRMNEFRQHYISLSDCDQRQIILLGCQNVQKTQRWLKYHGIKLDYPTLEKQVDYLYQLQSRQLCDVIFRCKMRNLAYPFVDYYQQVYSYWKQDIERNKKRKFYPKHNKENVQEPEEKCQKNNEQKDYKAKEPKLKNVQSDSTIATLSPRGQMQKEERNEQICFKSPDFDVKKNVNKRKKVKQHRQYNPESEQTPNSKKDKSNELQMKQNDLTKDQRIYQNQRKDAFLAKTGQELLFFADRLSQEANHSYQRRIIAFQRIQVLLSYFNISIQLFGSCASGIALKNSDIDIAVKSQILSQFGSLPPNQRLKAALTKLKDIFATQWYINDIQVISTASVPIIKMKIDTSEQFFAPFIDENFIHIYQTLNRPHDYGIVQADISIEAGIPWSKSKHAGVKSTQLTNAWLSEIPALRCIVLMMKQFLQLKRLNQTYNGGLSSYTMVILIVGYIQHAKLQKQLNPAKILESLLRFYVYSFDQKQAGIDLQDKKSNVFFNKRQRKLQIGYQNDWKNRADLQIIDPQCQTKILTRNCYLFPAIKNFFKQMLEFCFQQQLSHLQSKPTKKDWGIEEFTHTINRNVFGMFLEKVTSA